jgi:hypothetical protein
VALNTAHHEFAAVVEAFVRRVGLTEDERADYQTIDYESLKGVIRKLQEEQGHRGGLMDMNRLGPFLISMEKYGEVVQQIIDEPAIMHIVWVRHKSNFGIIPSHKAYSYLGFHEAHSGRKWNTPKF